MVTECFFRATLHCLQIGRTEVQKNQSSPKFADQILVDYFFESVQPLRFKVYAVSPPAFIKQAFSSLPVCCLTLRQPPPLPGLLFVCAIFWIALRCSYDQDNDSPDLSKQDFLGQVDVRLGEIVGLHRGVFTEVCDVCLRCECVCMCVCLCVCVSVCVHMACSLASSLACVLNGRFWRRVLSLL